MAFFIVTIVKTPNLTRFHFYTECGIRTSAISRFIETTRWCAMNKVMPRAMFLNQWNVGVLKIRT
jgi:hypothetical protein